MRTLRFLVVIGSLSLALGACAHRSYLAGPGGACPAGYHPGPEGQRCFPN
jgi:hypothetical protein